MRKKYSLALGGGAARGLSYIGVVKYLEESKVEIVEVSGTSIGAIIAGLIATGKTSNEMQEIAEEMNYLKLIDINMKQGLITGKKVYKKLEKIFGGVMIEDLDMPLKIVATCVEDGEKKVFSSGKLIDAIRASVSLPGIFSPYKIDGKSYIDGGIVNNLPVEVLNGKHVIAVTALKKGNEEMKMKRNVLGIDFNVGFFTHNFQILQKTIVLMMKQNELRSIHTAGKEVLLIQPDYGKLDFYSFNKVTELMDVGYHAIRKALK